MQINCESIKTNVNLDRMFYFQSLNQLLLKCSFFWFAWQIKWISSCLYIWYIESQIFKLHFCWYFHVAIDITDNFNHIFHAADLAGSMIRSRVSYVVVTTKKMNIPIPSSQFSTKNNNSARKFCSPPGMEVSRDGLPLTRKNVVFM